MAPSTDIVVADVRQKRVSIDRRMDMLRQRVERFSPKRIPWQAWSTRVWPVVATALTAWMWRRYRYNHRFMRLP